jgi:hypothetical protein
MSGNSLLIRYHLSDKIKEYEMQGACGTYLGREKYIPGFDIET